MIGLAQKCKSPSVSFGFIDDNIHIETTRKMVEDIFSKKVYIIWVDSVASNDRLYCISNQTIKVTDNIVKHISKEDYYKTNYGDVLITSGEFNRSEISIDHKMKDTFEIYENRVQGTTKFLQKLIKKLNK